MDKSWQVALASSDGINIDTHFGQANAFAIARLQADGSFALAGTRPVSPFCSGCGHEAMPERLAVLEGCRVLLAAKVGGFVKNQLEAHGILVLEQAMPIAEAMPKLAKYLRASG